MRTDDEWLLDGVCPRGHALYGHEDLYRRRTGETECNRCRLDMIDEAANLRLAAAERRAQGRS